MMHPDAVGREIRQARDRSERPVAANVLLPLARGAHFEAARLADVVVTFWGRPRRLQSTTWVHQCGSPEEARAACDAGADAVIAQGVEAGGHVRGREPATQLLERCLDALPTGYPVLSAGGIATADDVRERIDAGAAAVVAGTRFLMTDESRAHPAYRQRLMEARETVLTELFGVGWPAPHRVIWNEAAERWLARDPRGPRWVRAANHVSARLAARTPAGLQGRMVAAQRVGIPFFAAQPPTDELPSRLVDLLPLYAGETVARIHDIRPAAEVTRELAGLS